MATAIVKYNYDQAVVDNGPYAAVVSGALVVPSGPPGAQGPAGSGSGSSSQKIDQVAAAGTWILAHALGRMPMVDVFLSSGEMVMADVIATTSQVTVSFASPASGFIVII